MGGRKTGRGSVAAAVVLAAALAVGGVAVAYDSTFHMILEVRKDPQGRTIGYEVLHDTHKNTWIAMMSQSALGRWRCTMGSDDWLEVVQDEGKLFYVGRDGEPCSLALFQQAPPLVPGSDLPYVPNCPTCPR